MTEKRSRPIESFGPELLAALMRGATVGLELSLPYKDAVRFRLRVHQLRAAMNRMGHEKYPLVARVRITIEWPVGTPTERSGNHHVPIDRKTRCRVYMRPNDQEFNDALAAAGLDPLAGIEHHEPPSDLDAQTELDKLLADLGK